MSNQKYKAQKIKLNILWNEWFQLEMEMELFNFFKFHKDKWLPIFKY